MGTIIPFRLPEKKIVTIEVMPGEPLQEGYADYRLLLQRDGLILLAWALWDDKIKVVWCSSGRKRIYKYHSWVDSEAELSTICPERRYRKGCYHKTNGNPDYIVYAAPPDLSSNTIDAFIAKLQEAGVTVDFNFKFTLGEQKKQEKHEREIHPHQHTGGVDDSRHRHRTGEETGLRNNRSPDRCAGYR